MRKIALLRNGEEIAIQSTVKDTVDIMIVDAANLDRLAMSNLILEDILPQVEKDIENIDMSNVEFEDVNYEFYAIDNSVKKECYSSII